MSWYTVGSAAVSLGSSYLSGKNKGGSTQSTSSFQMDPGLSTLLFGPNSSEGGLLRDVAAMSKNPQSPGLAQFGNGMDSYLGGWGTNNLMRAQQSVQKLMETQNAAPQMANTQGVNTSLVSGAKVKAPAQNDINLSGAFNNMIYGDAGANPYLNKAVQGGIDQSKLAFGQMQEDATRNLNENVLAGIKSNSIASGGFGGSRQGLAEGRAIGDFARAQQNAINQFGQNNTNAAVGAQSQAFNQGQDRALSALLNLSGQQYGTASQNAAMEQQAALANQNAFQNSETTNAGLRQATNAANLQAQLANNQLESQNIAAGAGLSSALLNQAYGYGQNNSNAAFNRLTQGTSALSPFTGLGTQTTNTPYYTNSGASALGGAAAGLSLFNQFGGSSMFGGGGGGSSAPMSTFNVSPGSAGDTSWLSNISWM